jgi:hypothetical protein
MGRVSKSTSGRNPWFGRGNSSMVKKTGYFSMESNEAKYYGMVKDGKYHGEGHLITLESEYKGVFCEGVKEGMGV